MSRLFRWFIGLSLSGISSYSLAAGFALNEQSASNMGRAFAGRASSADDAGTVFGNPAGMSRLQRAEISGGAALINTRTDIKNGQGNFGPGGLFPVNGSNDGDVVPNVTVPFLYYARPINERWSAGVGLYAPFGLLTDYEDSFQGRYQGLKSEVEVVTLQPTVSFRMNPQWSVGAGLTYNRIEGELTSAIPQTPLPTDGYSNIEGDDTTWGYNLGILFEPSDNTRVGLTYHGAQEYTLDGHTTLNTALGRQHFDAKLDLTLPESVEFAVTHEVGERWTVHAGATWTRWSRFDELKVENAGGPTIVEPERWKDVWAYAIGADFRVNDRWLLRGGVALDQSPIPDRYRTVRIPSNDRTLFALGTAWAPSPDVTVDIAYTYLREKTADINQTREFNGVPFRYSAEYENNAHIIAAQFSYRF